MSEGSLTRAAQVLAITQPAASQALKRLHDAVGESLFVRNATGMTPTPKAEALWPQVRSALASLQQALAPGEFDAQAQDVSFRLAMADAVAAMLAPPLVDARDYAWDVDKLDIDEVWQALSGIEASVWRPSNNERTVIVAAVVPLRWDGAVRGGAPAAQQPSSRTGESRGVPGTRRKQGIASNLPSARDTSR